MYKYYKTIGNLIESGLFSKRELIEAYAQYSYETGKQVTEPVEYWYHEGERYRSRDINSVDFRFYLAVKTVKKSKINNALRER